jgi:hypothetical protein
VKVLVPTRKRDDGKTEYFCAENCQSWVSGEDVTLINVTGYTELICRWCGKTLVEDWYDTQEIESGR